MKPFKKGDRDAIILLFAGALICIMLFPFINELTGISNVEKDKTNAFSRREHRYSKYKAKEQQYYYVPEKQGELFPFDPNTADSTQFLRLGLRPWQVRNIYKYRAAGGRYRKPTDFARLYGLTLKQYKRLEPYIRIEKEVMAADVYGNTKEKYPRHHYDYPVKLTKGERVNINTADTAQLMKVPGIGSYYARQIVGKRARLGGFASPKQLLEIDGFPEKALEYMEVGVGKQSGKSVSAASEHNNGDAKAKESSPNVNANALTKNNSKTAIASRQSSESTAKSSESTAKPTGELKKIRVNHDDVRTMAKHPYMRYFHAKDIEKYRRLKGKLKSAADLRRLPSFTPDDIARLTPYLDFD